MATEPIKASSLYYCYTVESPTPLFVLTHANEHGISLEYYEAIQDHLETFFAIGKTAFELELLLENLGATPA